ncbi:MYCBP-associated protein-like [Leptidea sinapis]|uniref:MYCBP-associated protein-like n=1 Tax=Leptidea sinapis TaxID=189913 RepID=UPI002123DDA8|nr:MYCBP-associated protein-like [Leptidea sinapis]
MSYYKQANKIKFDNNLDPDKELLEWEKWIQIRKEETEHLSRKLKRPPVDLTMNIVEKVREDKERKTVLEHAQIETKPKVRGFLWEQPQRLKQSCDCQPIYEVQRTRAEMGRPRIIEHISVPKYVQETDKCITGVPERKPCTQLDSEYIKYRDKRENELKEKVDKLNPYKSAMENLMVKGSNPKPRPPTPPVLPILSYSLVLNQEEEASVSIYALRINNSIFYKEVPGQSFTYLKALQQEPWHESCTSWPYYYNTPINRACRSKILLKNIGTVTLKYCWRSIKRSLPFIPMENMEQVFFFNKNEDVIYPGQSKELCVTFVSSQPGIYNESWELCTTNVCFFDLLTEKFTFNYTADSVEPIERLRKRGKNLEVKIGRIAIRNNIRSIIMEIIRKSVTIEPEKYPYKKLLLEREMFIMKNPVCFYHQTEVLKMSEIYIQMNPGEVWDLSIANWRKAMMGKEFEERMMYYEILQKSHMDLLKPWYEGEELLAEKYRAVKLLLGNLADRIDHEYYNIMNEIFYSQSQPNILSASNLTVTGSMRFWKSPGNFIDRNIFYLRVHEHVATTIETCAGVLSSIDLNRWIKFDFCRA